MRRIAILMIAIAFLLCGCDAIVKELDETTKHNIESSSEEIKGNDANIEVGGTEFRNLATCTYMTLEELISNATNVTDIIKAKFVHVTKERNGTYSYVFEVVENVRGLGDEKTITVTDLAVDCEVTDRGIVFSTYDVPYKQNKEYLLLLIRSVSVYSTGYSFSFLNPSLVIPLSDDRNADLLSDESRLYGDLLSKHLGSKSIPDVALKGSFEEYLLDAMESNPFVNGDYVLSADMTEILRESDFVLEVVIKYIHDNPMFAKDRLVCDCEVFSSLKGEFKLPNGEYSPEMPMIIFPLGDYKVGDSYIVCVFSNDSSTILTMSSKNSVFSADQKDEIISALTEKN